MNKTLEGEPELTVNVDQVIGQAQRSERRRSALALLLGVALVSGLTGPPVTLPTSEHSSGKMFAD
jgi:hypothetical protein